MNAEERILEYALERHFKPEAPMDLAQRVAERWSQGEAGSLETWELEELLLQGESADLAASSEERGARATTQHTPALKRGLVLRLGLLAAGLLALALGVRYWSGSEPAGPDPALRPAPWQAQLSTPLRILRGADPQPVLASAVQAGDVILVEEGMHELELMAGLQLRVDAPAMFSIERPEQLFELSVYLGRLGLSSDAGVQLRANGARLAALAPSRFELGPARLLEGDEEYLEPAKARELLLGSVGGAEELSVVATLGELRVTRSQRELRLDPSSPRAVAARDYLVTYESWAAVLGTIQEIMPRGPKGVLSMIAWDPERAMKRSMDLALLIEAEPGLWSVLERELLSAVALGNLNFEHASVLLDLLITQAGPEPLDVARSLWLRAPEAFESVHIAALAALGCFEFQREVLAQLSHWRADPTLLKEDPLIYAVAAALQGDPSGQDLLEEALEAASEKHILSGEFALAALALERLGVGGAWELGADRLNGFAQRALEEGELRTVAGLVEHLEALATYRQQPELQPWSGALTWMARWSYQDPLVPDSEEDLRQRLALALGR